jgi:hypothetical protein
MSVVIPAAALQWMEVLLRERLGLSVVLAPAEGFTSVLVHGQGGSIQVRNQWDLFFRGSASLDCSGWNAAAEGWVPPVATSIPSPGLAQTHGRLIERTQVGYHLNYDVLSLAAWVLSRREEVDSPASDEHERFPARASHAWKHRYLDRPIVDEWLNILGQLVDHTWPNLVRKHHSFLVAPSHDVDHPSRYGFLTFSQTCRAVAREVLRERNLMGAAKAAYIRMGTKDSLHPLDPANTFDYIMSASEKRGLGSSFYFICGRTNREKDAFYEPGHPAIRKLIRMAHARGHEVGLHPSYGTYLRPDLLAREAEALRIIAAEERVDQELWGGRMHFLRWRQPETLRAWEETKFDYDSTLGYADMPGFRCGTCFEYQALDPVRLRTMSIRIRPLIAMECTVIHPRYLGLGITDEALQHFLLLKNRCRSVGGTFTILWHNSELCDPASRSLYEAVLDG